MNKYHIAFLGKETNYAFLKKIPKYFKILYKNQEKRLIELLITGKVDLVVISSDFLNIKLIQEIKKNDTSIPCIAFFEKIPQWSYFSKYWELGLYDFFSPENNIDELELRFNMAIHQSSSPVEQLRYHSSLSKDILEERLLAQDKILHNSAAIVMTDIKGNITYANENFSRISQYNADEIMGKTHSIINSGRHPTEFFRKMWKTIAKGDVWNGEVCNRKKDGTLYWTDTSIIPILNELGKPEQYLALRFDITEYKELELELKAQKDELIELNLVKDKMFSIISHDFRSPLRSLQGVLNLISLEEVSQQEIQYLAGDLNEKVNYTLNLLENLLHWAKSQMEKGMEVVPEAISLEDILNEVLQIVEYQAEKKDISIQNNLQTDFKVYIDANMLSVIFRNLLSNAIKFTKKGGLITLKVRNQNDQMLEISVQDTGVGISSEALEKIFDKKRHFTTIGTDSEKGTGLGLNLVEDFVKRNGGEIWVESEIAKGSKFTFTLPLAKEEQTVG